MSKDGDEDNSVEMEEHDAEKDGFPKKKKFPKSVFFIVGNEFCERFSYYGMRAVLILYMTDQLGIDNGTATIIYHTFVMLCYFSPIGGAWLADSWLGKFRTIFYVSILYAFGNIVLSLASMPPTKIPMIPFSMVGLFLIAMGTGGIKPCVSAFGGDQFDSDQLKQRERFFFVFYFSINCGSLISTFVTPILRGDVSCFGSDSCFSLAFGVPAILMIISIFLFVSGKFMYRMIPPQGNIVAKVSSCVVHALRRRHKSEEKRSHWLEYADDKYDAQFIRDVRAALRVMYLYIPLPVFWALFEQQGSTWTIQATAMDGRLTSNYVILPDQMQVVNPLLILLFIPIFESGVYPLLARCNLFKRHLPRIFTGGVLAGVAFFVAGFIQLKIEQGLPVTPNAGTVDITYMNSMNCSVLLNTNSPAFANRTLNGLQSWTDTVTVDGNYQLPLSVTPFCVDIDNVTSSFSVQLNGSSTFDVIFSNYDSQLQMLQNFQSRTKPDNGSGEVRFFYSLDTFYPNTNIMLKSGHDSKQFPIVNSLYFSNSYQSLKPDYYDLYLPNGNDTLMKIDGVTVDVESGGVYTVAIQAIANLTQVTVLSNADVKANQVKMLWQIPQYVIITMGEIMFSITGLAFSYSQAPASMKSVLQAAWLLTDAFGNVIIIILESIPMFKDQSSLFFLYASIMVVVMMLFAWMGYGYEYVTVDSEGKVHFPGESPVESRKSSISEKIKNGINSMEEHNAGFIEDGHSIKSATSSKRRSTSIISQKSDF
ncbi:hypothetical protein CHUAL_011142 [Chamberlinius hualienensis]